MLKKIKLPSWKNFPSWLKWLIRGILFGFLLSSIVLIIDSAMVNSEIQSLNEDLFYGYMHSSPFYDLSYSRSDIFAVFKFMIYTTLSFGFAFWLLHEFIRLAKRHKFFLLYPVIGILSGMILTRLGLMINKEKYFKLIELILNPLSRLPSFLKIIIIFSFLLILFLTIICLVAFLVYKNENKMKRIILNYQVIKERLVEFYLKFKNKYQIALSYLKWGAIISLLYTLVGSIRIAQGWLDTVFLGIPTIITDIFYKPAPGFWSNQFLMIATYVCMPIVGFLSGIILKLIFSLIKKR